MSDRKRWTKWSKYEEKILTLYDPFWITRADIAERIGRSPRAVQDKLFRMRKNLNGWRKWTPEEEKLLLEMGRKAHWRASHYLGAFPGRSYASIKRHLYILRKKAREASQWTQ